MSRYQKGTTNLDFTEARDSEWQWHQLGCMQVCTLLQTKKLRQHPTTQIFICRMPFLPPNQQSQSNEGDHTVNNTQNSDKDYLVTSFPAETPVWFVILYCIDQDYVLSVYVSVTSVSKVKERGLSGIIRVPGARGRSNEVRSNFLGDGEGRSRECTRSFKVKFCAVE